MTAPSSSSFQPGEGGRIRRPVTPPVCLLSALKKSSAPVCSSSPVCLTAFWAGQRRGSQYPGCDFVGPGFFGSIAAAKSKIEMRHRSKEAIARPGPVICRPSLATKPILHPLQDHNACVASTIRPSKR